MAYCLNCNHSFSENENYCTNCGQKTTIRPLSFWQIVRDFFANLFNFEAKIWRTLRDIWIPGKLTKAYVAGKRQRYYNPLRIFVIVLFAYFALYIFELKSTFGDINKFSIEQEHSVWKDDLILKYDSISAIRPFDSTEIQKFKRALFALKLPLWDSLGYKFDIESIEAYEDIVEEENEIESDRRIQIMDSLMILQGARADTIMPDTITDDGTFDLPTFSYSLEEGAEFEDGDFLPGLRTADFFSLTPEELKKKYGKEDLWREVLVVQTQKILKNAGTSFKFFISNGTWATVALILLLALCFKLLYLRRGILYAEHFIFHLYGHTRLFILAIIGMVISLFVDIMDFWNTLLFIGGVVYLFLSMKRYYGQGFWKTLIKFFITVNVYFFLLILCAGLVFGISFLVF